MNFGASHQFIHSYLSYVDNTESPRLFHVWAALSGLSACMGRRCWYPMGTGEIFPNQYVLFSGPPGVRKSTAVSIMVRNLRKSTGVRFAPDDTGGQRQGLISAMVEQKEEGENDEDKEIIARISAAANERKQNGGGTTLADLEMDVASLGTLHIDTRDPHTLFIAANELNSVLGEGNTQLLTFLQKMWDGDSYDYRLKSTSHVLTNGLLGILGATTPSQIALSMPAEAIGQGFTSRAIFVFADKKHSRRIARPTLNLKVEEEIGDTYRYVFETFSGSFCEDPDAARLLDELYERGIAISDPRFVHYTDRRHTHLQKLSMALAASRKEQIIREIDVKFADELLLYTEGFMADALGEYGMNKLGAAKQRLMDMLKNTSDPIPVNALYGMLARDMSMLDYKATIAELHNAKKLSITTLPNIGQCIIAVSDSAARKAKKDLTDLERLMTRT